jgi:hypothetical protein
MKRKYKTITKDTIISTRISDDEMYNVRQLMDRTNLSASEIMRKAFYLQVERFCKI